MTHKELCAELTEALTTHAKPSDGAVGYVAGLLTRARAALAEPEPEPPTDEGLKKLLYLEFTQSTGHGHSEDPIGFARAVLARWGRCPTNPRPTP